MIARVSQHTPRRTARWQPPAVQPATCNLRVCVRWLCVRMGVQPRATTGRKRTGVWYHILDARAEKHKEIVVAVVSNVAQRERGAVPSLVTQRKGLLQTVRAALHARLGVHLRDSCRGSVASLTRGIRTQRIAGGIKKMCHCRPSNREV